MACLLHINDAKNKSGQGVAQGDPTSGDCFSVILQPSLVRLDSDCREGGGMARAGHDDIYGYWTHRCCHSSTLHMKFGRYVDYDFIGIRLSFSHGMEIFLWSVQLVVVRCPVTGMDY